MGECEHRYAVLTDCGLRCRDCDIVMKSVTVTMPESVFPDMQNPHPLWCAGYDAGYAAAKAEMLSKLDTFNPVYVEGGRVPEDAIEHRNQPRAKE